MSRLNELKRFTLGFLLLIGIHSIAIAVGVAIYNLVKILFSNSFTILNNTYVILLFLLFGIGLLQFIYVIPMLIFLIRKRRFSMAKGVILAAVLTLVLNTAFWMWVSAWSDV